MSSPANSSLPSSQPTPSGSMRTGSRQQEQHRANPDHANQPASSQRQHPLKGRRSTHGGPSNRQNVTNNLKDYIENLPIATDSSSGNPGSSNTSHDINSQPDNGAAIGDVARSAGSNKFRGGQCATRGGGRGSSSGGKYKQRQQMNQLIDGMDGLDIDLIESIAPTNRPNDSGKGRHVTVTRKVNLTHLLNYDRQQRGGRRNRTFNEERRGAHHQTYYRDCNNVHKFNKQQFLQANCQFVVLPFHDYTIHKVDPDWPIDWNCIEEVIFRQTGTTETICPICLDPPISAKITKCGHIYCWTCMLHYLSLCDDKSRLCPICFEPVSEEDLRSVVSRLYSNHAVDEDITLHLMFRRKGCVEIKPYSRGDQIECRQDVFSTEEHYGSQANLLIVQPSTVIAEVAKREQDELLLKLSLDRDEPEVCFVDQAMVKLNQRIERLRKLSAEPPECTKSPWNPKYQSAGPATSQNEDKSFLFYQSADGQHIYLNPFSTKILCHEYGSLENCPLEIRARVLQMDWISMSESWRKRFKYLEHLPLTCEFRLIEIDFEASNLVCQDTYASYIDQIKMRAGERAFRKTEEMKRDKIIQIEQNRKIYGIQPSLTINLDNMEQFPSVFEDSRNDQIKTPTPDGNDTEQQTAPSLDRTTNPEDNFEEELHPGAVLSFKEIQERQEAAEAAKSSSTSQPKTTWVSSKARSKDVPQSSFAKLLIDAKSSPKQWTRSANPSAPKQSASNQSTNINQQPRSSLHADDDDDGGEELRAPPCRFTIGDMLTVERVGKRSRKRS